MKTITEELLAANDALRAEFPSALIVDASFRPSGFLLTMIPAATDQDSQFGKGTTIADALADLQAKVAAADPLAKLRKQAEKAGFSMVANSPAQPPL